mmetsp:Transcript_12655/g.40428  ORF Transcript_12655/g.40428 Transcript_12655/m.40428 type:complete len:346 (-) Transcript_12655:765-1802(-)
MMALLRAMACTPSARVMVTTVGSPSGMSATATLTPDVSESCSDLPRSSATPNVATATTMHSTDTVNPNDSMLSSSGVLADSTLLISELMRPISASSPVATTTAVPCPVNTSVPRYPMHERSPSTADASTGSAVLAMGADSPVSVASVTRSDDVSIQRTSAGMRSPEARKSTSPTTSSDASTVRFRPLRSTSAVDLTIALIAWVAASALPSCTTPITTLTTTTVSTKPASTHSAYAALMPAAAIRIAVITLYNCSQIIWTSVRRFPGVSVFGPFSASRRAASSLDRPSEVEVPSRFSTSSAGMENGGGSMDWASCFVSDSAIGMEGAGRGGVRAVKLPVYKLQPRK